MIRPGEKVYLGDGVYLRWAPDGYHLVLTTENGLPTDPSNAIYLEPRVVDMLRLYTDPNDPHRPASERNAVTVREDGEEFDGTDDYEERARRENAERDRYERNEVTEGEGDLGDERGNG